MPRRRTHPVSFGTGTSQYNEEAADDGSPAAGTTAGQSRAQSSIVAVCESRAVSPTTGLAFVNLDSGAAVLCQIADNQAYERTMLKLRIHAPSEIIVISSTVTARSHLTKSIQLSLCLAEGGVGAFDRKYWSEDDGRECIEQLAFSEDMEATRVALDGKSLAVSSFAAVRHRPSLTTCGVLNVEPDMSLVY